jgi:NAD(P)H-nitrite reductase large subunit
MSENEDTRATSEVPDGAILQRDGETYAIVPRLPLGLLSPEVLEAVATVARRYAVPVIKITSGQRLALVGIQRQDLDAIWRDLSLDVGRATELCVHYVQACPGTDVCSLGVQDSIGVGRRLEELFVGLDAPAKVKIGVSGCTLCCAESLVRDVGLIASKKGWKLVFGGSSSRRPRVADEIARRLDADRAVELVRRCLEVYRDNAKPKERTAKFMDRFGVEAFRRTVLGEDA